MKDVEKVVKGHSMVQKLSVEVRVRKLLPQTSWVTSTQPEIQGSVLVKGNVCHKILKPR